MYFLPIPYEYRDILVEHDIYTARTPSVTVEESKRANHPKHENDSLNWKCSLFDTLIEYILPNHNSSRAPFPLWSIHPLIGSNFLQVRLLVFPIATGKPSKMYSGEGVKSP
jgi:hypothetical protein